MQLEIYKNFSWLLETPPIFDAIESIKFLVGKGHELKIITSRYPDAKEHIENWLTNHSINIPLVCIGHGISKADEAKLLDVFVDDSVKKLTELEGVVPNKFLFTQPYNSEDVLIKQIYRINNWKDLLSKIETLLTDPIV
jgi:uncharacterized HAD superfamily protein